MKTHKALDPRPTFLRWAEKLKLPEPAVALVSAIRSSPPSRRTRGHRSVRGTYPSAKMRLSIQFESHRNEYPALLEFEHDPDVLEFYDQPPAIKLNYRALNGRSIGVLHTPDYFVLRRGRAEWVECKTEDELRELALEMPHRYVKQGGVWTCPPGVAYAAQFGLGYKLRSSTENSAELTRNLNFLEDFYRRNYPAVAKATIAAAKEFVAGHQGATASELLRNVRDLSVDDLSWLLASGTLYADLRSCLLIDRDSVAVFSDRIVADSIARAKLAQQPSIADSGAPIILQPTARVTYAGVPHVIIDVDDQLVHLSDDSGKSCCLKRSDFDHLVDVGTIRGLTAPDARAQQALERIKAASPEDLRIALDRWHEIQPFLQRARNGKAGRRPSDRSIRRWLTVYQTTEQSLGNGFIGLLPGIGRRGNALPRISAPVRELMDQFIREKYETPASPLMSHVHRLLSNACLDRGYAAPSLRTFSLYIRKRPQYEQLRKREGRRSAYAKRPSYLYIDMTTPIHGDRPWEIAHIDHTTLDIELVCSRTGKNLGKPWFTLMTDAFSRRIVGIALSFEDPKSLSCMMVIRNCVRRHHRLPHILVIDNGKEFDSVYFETLLAAFDVTKKSRPPANPRFGAVCERLFGTTNTEFVHNLTGNTKLMKRARVVTKSVDPRNHAAWTLEDLTEVLAEYCFEVYDTITHPALGESPRDAYNRGMENAGPRPHVCIPYDNTFEILSMPSTKSGRAKIDGQSGLRINHLDYWSQAFLKPGMDGLSVPVRFDPWDASTAYAYVDKMWVLCRSNLLVQFQHKSVRSIVAAGEELRKEKKLHSASRSITARQLADFMERVAQREETLIASCKELANRAALSRLHTPVVGIQPESADSAAPASAETGNVTPFPTQSHETNESREATNDAPVEDYDYPLEFSDNES